MLGWQKKKKKTHSTGGKDLSSRVGRLVKILFTKFLETKINLNFYENLEEKKAPDFCKHFENIVSYF